MGFGEEVLVFVALFRGYSEKLVRAYFWALESRAIVQKNEKFWKMVTNYVLCFKKPAKVCLLI